METYGQTDLLHDLVKIFPEFAAYWEEDKEGFCSSSLHCVYMSLLPFLHQLEPTKEQWRLLANHLSDAIASEGTWKNAAHTCVLEHLHQIELDWILRPLLSVEAQAHVRT